MEDMEQLVSPKRECHPESTTTSSPIKTSSDLPPHPPSQGQGIHFEEAALVAHTSAKLRNRAKKKLKKHGKERPKLSKRRMSQFERRYTQLALTHELIPERKRIDYVLVHPSVKPDSVKDDSRRTHLLLHESNRNKFESLLRREGFSIQKETIGGLVYVKLHCPFKRLCVEAERVKLQLPLKDCKVEASEHRSRLSAWIERHFETDDEEDYVSSIFIMDKIHLFERHEDPTAFFRPALRSFLCHHILINLDIRTMKEKEVGWPATSQEEQSRINRCLIACCGKRKNEAEKRNTKVLKRKDNGDHGDIAVQSLPYLLMKQSYTDAYILHEDSIRRAKKEDAIDGHFEPETKEEEEKMKDEIPLAYINDPRKNMDDTWTVFYKFQPLWKIRNYFGEKIAFYFAWSGMLITSLWVPTFFGLGIFLYGLALSIEEDMKSNTTSAPNATFTEELKSAVTGVLGVIKKAFDNDVTPYFALIVCLWGTVFLEMWKRKVARLAYEWDVDDFEASEPDRPQFFGTKVKPDPVTNEETWFYPLKRQLMKFTTSASVLIFMISIVLISVTGVIVYRVIVGVDMCPSISGAECLLLTTVISSLLNAISILLLGKFYDKLAVWLTEWENHRTQTRYDDALIIKLFAFQFVNSYASCFYIAFFRGKLLTECKWAGLGRVGLADSLQCIMGQGRHLELTAGSRSWMQTDKLFVDAGAFEREPSQSTRNSSDLVITTIFCVHLSLFELCLGSRFDSLGILGRGANYKDSCEGTCMSQLSFQVLVLMLMKPFPKFFKDIVVPVLKKLWRRRPCCRKTKVDVESPKNKSAAKEMQHQSFLERERLKPTLGDFTLGEYTEKVIQYGFLMLFAASFPLAPLLALLTNLIDMRVDAKRMLWFNRRPLAFIAQDIGMWYDILTFVNFCGVLTNAFLIAFTSSWGGQFGTVGKLWVVIGFEHIVFILKYILAYMIPDVPMDVRLSIRREKYQVAKKLDHGKKETMDFAHLFPESRSHNNSETDDDNAYSNTRGDINEANIAEEVSSVPPPSSVRKTLPASNNDLWYISNKDGQTELDKSQDMVSMSAIHPHGSRLLQSETSQEAEEGITVSRFKQDDTYTDNMEGIPEETEPVGSARLRSKLRSHNNSETDDDNAYSNTRGDINEANIAEEVSSVPPPSSVRKTLPASNNDLWYISNKDGQTELDKSQDMVSMSAIHPHGSRLLQSETSQEAEEGITVSRFKQDDTYTDNMEGIPEETEPVGSARLRSKLSPPVPMQPVGQSNSSHNLWSISYQDHRGSFGEYSV